MTVTFLEPGGDATLNVASGSGNGLWGMIVGVPTVATDFVHGNHLRSIQYGVNSSQKAVTPVGTLADTGSRISFYLNIKTYPNATFSFSRLQSSAGGALINLRITTTGILQLWNQTTAQIGTDGPTLATGSWYRISLAYTITSTTVNRFELFVDAVSAVSVTNATITATGTSQLALGDQETNTVVDFRTSDHYLDNSNSLIDTGDIWVTAKRPNANGTANNFTTQIGAGGSGYGSGHSPQVNERIISQTNGWSMVGAGAVVTEEYTVEDAGTGDMSITGKTIVDWHAWIDGNAAVGELASIIAGGTSSSYTCTAAARVVTLAKGSTIYPVGGTDVGMITDTSLTTVRLFECGVMIAFIGPPNPTGVSSNLLLMGTG